MIAKRNFTLIELLVVMAVIAILAGIALGASGYVIRKNKESRTLATIEMLKLGLEQYKAQYGFYPPSIPFESAKYIPFRLDVCQTSAAAGNNQNNNNNFNKFVDFMNLSQPEQSDRFHTNGTACSDVSCANAHYYTVKDAFGHPIYYRCPGFINRATFDLGSLGADGLLGDGVANWDLKSNNDFGKGDDITNCKR